MYDGAALGEAVAAHPDDIETTLAGYEQAMLPRNDADPDLHDMVDDGAADKLINAFTGS